RYVRCVCFFFQAEDGIRDFHVTGVQTCALPIWTSALVLPAHAGMVPTSRLIRVTVSRAPRARGDGPRRAPRMRGTAPGLHLTTEIGRASCRERAASSGGG